MEYELVEHPRKGESPLAIPPRLTDGARKASPFWSDRAAARDSAIAIPEQEWGA